MGAVVVTELLDGSIRSRHQLSGVVASHLVVAIPYMNTHTDIVRARWRKFLVWLTALAIFVTLAALAVAIVFHLPIDLSWLADGRQ
jgi:hypothetical protein